MLDDELQLDELEREELELDRLDDELEQLDDELQELEELDPLILMVPFRSTNLLFLSDGYTRSEYDIPLPDTYSFVIR